MKSLRLILFLMLISVSSILILHSGIALLQPTLIRAPQVEQKKQYEVRSMNSIMKITRGPNTMLEKDKGGIERQEQSNKGEPTNSDLVEFPAQSRILHFPMQPMDLTISPAEAALHSATIAAK